MSAARHLHSVPSGSAFSDAVRRAAVEPRRATAVGPATRAPSSRRSGRVSSRTVRRQLRRRRLAGLLRFVVFLFFIFVAVWAGVRVAHAGPDASVYTGHQYVVRAGDSLWSIAAREYGADADVRRAVFEIGRANSMGDAGLRPGQRLTLPYLGQ